MKMKKKILILGMCVVMAFSITACSDKDKKENETTTTASEDSSEEETTIAGSNEKDKVVDGDSEVVELADYTKLEAPKADVEVAATDVESSIDSILAGFPVTEGTVKDTDVVNIDFVGKLNGEEFEGASAEGQTLDIANSTYIEGFAEGLVGKKIGDTVDLNLKFPEDYGKEELNGKDVVFTVTINSVSSELTDEFVEKNLKSQYDVSNVEELKAYVEDQMRLSKIYELVWSKYMSDCVANVSKEKVEDLVESGVSYYEAYLSSMTETKLEDYLVEQGSSLDEFKEVLREEAVVSIKEQGVIEEIASKEKIEVTEEEYEKEVEYYMETYDIKTKEEFEDQYAKEEVVANVLYYKVVEWVCNQVKITE